MSFKNNEEREGEEKSVTLVLGKLSQSNNNAVVAEVVDTEKVEPGSETLTLKEADFEITKAKTDDTY